LITNISWSTSWFFRNELICGTNSKSSSNLSLKGIMMPSLLPLNTEEACSFNRKFPPFSSSPKKNLIIIYKN